MSLKSLLRFTSMIAISAVAALGAPSLLLGGAPQKPSQPAQSLAEICSSDRFSVNSQDPVQCCQDGNRTWDAPDSQRLVYRVYGLPCREADGVGTNCGEGSSPFVQCTYGPCGGRVEWAIKAQSVHIFLPVSKPSKCGWEALGILDCIKSDDADGCGKLGGTRSYPESYTGQPLYPGVIPTCGFTKCLVGGTPAV